MNRRETKLLVESWRSLMTESSDEQVVKKIDVTIKKILRKFLSRFISKESIEKHILLSIRSGDLNFSFEKKLSESVVKNSLYRILNEESGIDEEYSDMDESIDSYYKDLKVRLRKLDNKNVLVGLLFIKKIVNGELGKASGYSGKSQEILSNIFKNLSDSEYEKVLKELPKAYYSLDVKKFISILKNKPEIGIRSLDKDVKEKLRKRNPQSTSHDRDSEWYIKSFKTLLNDYKRYLDHDGATWRSSFKEIDDIITNRKTYEKLSNMFGEEFRRIETSFSRKIKKLIQQFIDENDLHSMSRKAISDAILSSDLKVSEYRIFKDKYIENEIKNKKDNKISRAKLKYELDRFKFIYGNEENKEKSEKRADDVKSIMDKIHGDYKSGRRKRGVQAGKVMKRYY